MKFNQKKYTPYLYSKLPLKMQVRVCLTSTSTITKILGKLNTAIFPNLLGFLQCQNMILVQDIPKMKGFFPFERLGPAVGIQKLSLGYFFLHCDCQCLIAIVTPTITMYPLRSLFLIDLGWTQLRPSDRNHGPQTMIAVTEGQFLLCIFHLFL